MVPLSEEKQQENEGIQKIIYHTVNSARYGVTYMLIQAIFLFSLFSRGGGGRRGVPFNKVMDSAFPFEVYFGIGKDAFNAIWCDVFI